MEGNFLIHEDIAKMTACNILAGWSTGKPTVNFPELATKTYNAGFFAAQSAKHTQTLLRKSINLFKICGCFKRSSYNISFTPGKNDSFTFSTKD